MADVQQKLKVYPNSAVSGVDCTPQVGQNMLE